MRKPVVSYKNFRLSKLRDPEYSHLLWLLGWIGYFIAYFVTENFIPESECYMVYSPLDDMIPFCEYFVVPYVLWYAWIVGSLLYFMFYNPVSFKNMMKFIIITQVCATIIYVAFPNGQALRPEVFERDNIFTRIIGSLYSFDTNTNVFPSLHVAYSIGIASVWVKEKDASVLWKIFMVVFGVLVILSTAFIKQHSILDAFGALPICIAAEIIVFGKSHYGMFKGKKKDISQE